MSRLRGIILTVAMAATPLLATTVQKMDLPELVSASDNIVQGRVESVEARYENSMTYTYVSIAVDDPIKGGPRRNILIRQLGGKIGAKIVWIAGMPQFKTGDQVILFLKDRRNGTFDVVGLNQGKYDIVDSTAVAHVSGVTIVDPRTGLMSDAGFVEKAPLIAFKARIKELMR